MEAEAKEAAKEEAWKKQLATVDQRMRWASAAIKAYRSTVKVELGEEREQERYETDPSPSPGHAPCHDTSPTLALA